MKGNDHVSSGAPHHLLLVIMAAPKKRKKKELDGEGEKSGRRLDRPGRRCGGGRMADGGMADGGKWIQGAIKHPGALHKQLGVPEGEKIPAGKLAKAAHSDNPTLARRARLAQTLKGFHKKD